MRSKSSAKVTFGKRTQFKKVVLTEYKEQTFELWGPRIPSLTIVYNFE